MTTQIHDAEATLLCDALAVAPTALKLLSREPLGAGTVAGFALDAGGVAYVDTSGLAVRKETGLALEGVARVWMHPADPHLPALAPAAFGDAAEALLARLGIVAEGLPEIVGYRPGRRAVLRVPVAEGTGTVWVKVVRPRRIERIVETHRALREGGLPVPVVRGWSPEGLLILDDAIGVAATDGAWQPDALVDAVDLLRERLAAAALPGVARTSFAARLPWYAERIEAAMPAHASEVRALAAAASARLPDAVAAQTIHGDLHIGQLFLDPGDGSVTGLIDVDTAGQGAAADDASAFIGHAIASAVLTAEGGDARRIAQLAELALARWASDAGTRALTAVHILGHALAAAESGAPQRAVLLLTAAREVLEDGKRPLTSGFERP